MRAFVRRHPCLALVTLALLLRVAAGCALAGWLDRQPDRRFLIEGDADGYWRLAERIRAGEEFSLYDPPRRVMRMPGFPLLLAAAGGNFLAARILLAAVGAAACGVTFLLGRELFDDQVGWIAGALLAASPIHVVFSVMILSEIAFALCIVLALWLTCRVRRRIESASTDDACGLLSGAVLAGAAHAAAVYVRPSWILAVPIAAIALAFSRNRSALVAGAAMLLSCVLCLCPWAARNYRLTEGRVVFTTLWAGPSLYDGLNPQADGSSDMTFFERDRVLDRTSEHEMDRHYRSAAWRFVRDNPGRTAWLAWRKQARYWSPWPNAEQFRSVPIALACVAYWLLLFVTAILGVRQVAIDDRNAGSDKFWTLLVTLGPLLYFASIHAVFVGSIRYRLPAEYPLAILAAAGIRGLCMRWFGEQPD